MSFLRPAGCRVVEVGPGGGVLTTLLLDREARVRAIEMDLEWALALRLAERRDELAIAVADAMLIEWKRLAPGTLVTGNLPYQISTALIERLLPLHDLIPRASFLVQREVGERLVARPGTEAYGSLSVLVAAFSEAKLLGRVARGSFRPPPKVEGAFVGFRLIAPPLPEREMRRFATTVRLAFGLRRKTLRNALAAGWGRERAREAISLLGKGDRVRAEELDLDGFLELHEISSSL
jgi:16S rRNA (adenine1518-N6/adenine1519-N6)-dimethyltransferase